MKSHSTLAPAVARTVAVVADLWCTYAAVRTLTWLGRGVPAEHAQGTIDAIRVRQNSDGGFAWMMGMPSDAWATAYCAETLCALGAAVPRLDDVAAWVESTRADDGGYAMMPGQAPDVWATHFGVRLLTEVCDRPVPSPEELRRWLAALQTREGGLTWTPEHVAVGRRSDVRACAYGVATWQATAEIIGHAPPWDVDRLVDWLNQARRPDGGYVFHEGAQVSCLWATYRAVSSIARLDRPVPPVAEFLRTTMSADGPIRWPGYDVADVWASFCWVGTAMSARLSIDPDDADRVEAAIAPMAVSGGGYTYRKPDHAADALAVSSTALLKAVDDDHDRDLINWLESCQLPNEDGVMYMPGRGAEVRCTLWALATGAFSDDPDGRRRIGVWLAAIQNPDGGFGYWDGRASDIVSTACAVAIATEYLSEPSLNTHAAYTFVESCRTPSGRFGPYPGGKQSSRTSLQALRTLGALGQDVDDEIRAVIADHRVRSGGVADVGRKVPDLPTTYEAVVAATRHHARDLVGDLTLLLDRLDGGDDGVAWSPMAPPTAEIMPRAMLALLRRDNEIPALALI